jgi:hypothetical protein
MLKAKEEPMFTHKLLIKIKKSQYEQKKKMCKQYTNWLYMVSGFSQISI